MFVYFCIIREKELDKQVENMNTIVREPFNNFKKGGKKKTQKPFPYFKSTSLHTKILMGHSIHS